MSSERALPTTAARPTCPARKKTARRRYNRRRSTSGRSSYRAAVNLKRTLAAGVRCHARFYQKLYAESMHLRTQADDWTGRALSKILGKIMGFDVFKAATDFRLVFEVNLGRRKPDCICMIRCPRGLWEASCDGACVIIELKTCRFSNNLGTASKKEQRLTGTKQLLDSKLLIDYLAPVGSERIFICPLLVFVSRRKLNVLRVTCLRRNVVSTDFHRLATLITLASEYKIKQVDRRRTAVRKPAQCARNFASLENARRDDRSEEVEIHTFPNCSIVLPPRTILPGAANTTMHRLASIVSCLVRKQ